MNIVRRIAWATVGSAYLSAVLPATGIQNIHPIFLAITTILGLALVTSTLVWGRQQRYILQPALFIVPLLLAEYAAGANRAWVPITAQGTIGLASALLILAIALTIALMGGAATANREHPEQTRRFVNLAAVSALLVYGLTLTGSYVISKGASQACPGWPLCGNAPAWAVQYHLNDINMLHRYAAIFVGLVLLWLCISAWRRREVAPTQMWLALAAGVLFVLQSGTGAFVTVDNALVYANILHLACSTVVWGSLVALTVLAAQQLNAESVYVAETQSSTVTNEIAVANAGGKAKAVSPWRHTISSYVNLMKPHVTVLLLGTTAAAMTIAGGKFPPLGLTIATLLGGAMAAGSANSLNCYIDRDIDQIMGRTQRRSLPAGKVKPRNALIFGIALGVGSFVLLTVFVNLLSAVLACSAILFYVLIYTMGLKRSTAQNIVIGGAAGAVPVLVGWAAVTNSLSLPAIWLFAIIFYWTPPHFWALSLLIQKDYEKANVPMMPVVMGEKETRKQIFLYSLLLLAVTLVLFAMHAMGYLYLAGALILGGILVYMALRLLRDQSKHWARTLFWYSNCYLAAIFAIMVLDRVLHI
jgi:protoheme IX farnesyltransferase